MGWTLRGGARPGGRSEARGRGEGGQGGLGGSYSCCGGGLAGRQQAVGNGVGELRPSAAAAAAEAVSVERVSASGTQDGAPR